MTYRIRKLDDKNLIIERKRKSSKRWRVHGYYGKPEDLIAALVKLEIKTPAGDTLPQQLDALAQQLDGIERRLTECLSTLLV